jgi:ribonuclease R
VVCTVRNFGIFVELPETLIQGLVHVSTLDDDFYQYDEQHERLVGKRTRRIIKIGDRLRVQVERVDVFKRQVDFRVVAEQRDPGKSSR